jgi:hypothetical protein
MNFLTPYAPSMGSGIGSESSSDVNLSQVFGQNYGVEVFFRKVQKVKNVCSWIVQVAVNSKVFFSLLTSAVSERSSSKRILYLFEMNYKVDYSKIPHLVHRNRL